MRWNARGRRLLALLSPPADRCQRPGRDGEVLRIGRLQPPRAVSDFVPDPAQVFGDPHGLLGHLAEERRTAIGMDVYLTVDRNARYVPPALD